MQFSKQLLSSVDFLRGVCFHNRCKCYNYEKLKAITAVVLTATETQKFGFLHACNMCIIGLLAN